MRSRSPLRRALRCGVSGYTTGTVGPPLASLEGLDTFKPLYMGLGQLKPEMQCEQNIVYKMLNNLITVN